MLSGHPQSTQNAALGLTSWQDKSWRMWAICPAHASMCSMASASPGSCVSALGGAFEEAAERGHSIKRTCAAFGSPVWLWRTDPARHRILGGPDTPSQGWSSTSRPYLWLSPAQEAVSEGLAALLMKLLKEAAPSGGFVLPCLLAYRPCSRLMSLRTSILR